MTNGGLERLVEADENPELIQREESTAEKIRKAVLLEKVPFEGIYGIRDVKENLMDALERASLISRQGYTPIILLLGPSGSGKTELINSILKAYKYYARSNDIFTLKINGSTCPYNENPFNLYRSILPKGVELPHDETVVSQSLMNKKRPEICRQCEHNLEKALKDGKNVSSGEMLERIYPQSSIVEFGDNILSPVFINVIKNSNRSILTISADKSRFEKINPQVFQLMNNVYDNNLSDTFGNRIPLDSLIIIHSNEGFMALPDDEKKESMPLLERIIRVDVRRNLSYSEEMKVIDEYNLPIKQMVPHFNEYIAKINVLSRLSTEIFNEADQDGLEYIISLLDSYDSSRLEEFETMMTRNTSDFLSKLLPDYNAYNSEKDKEDKRYLVDAAKILIMGDFGYKSGWSDGISARAISSIIDFNYKSKNLKGSLLFSDISAYLKKNEDRLDEYIYGEIESYIDREISKNVESDIDYAVLSFYFKDHFKDYTSAITAYFNSLINPNRSQEFKDTNGYLSDASRYFDVEMLKNEVTDFKKKMVPLGLVNYSADFRSIFDFLVHNDKNLIKKEGKFNAFLGESGKNIDKTSELYPYIKNFLSSNLGYFDDAVEEALKIYKEGSLMYDQ
jgi:GTPase SAR1 family protein